MNFQSSRQDAPNAFSAERTLATNLTVALCGTGSLFKRRGITVEAFRKAGVEVRVYPTSAESADSDAPNILRVEQIQDIVARADLTLLMLSNPQERGPSVERLELKILQRAEVAMGAFGFGCDSSGFEVAPEKACVVAQKLWQMRTKASFGFIPHQLHQKMRQDAGYGVRLLPAEQWHNPEFAEKCVLTMLEYTRA